MEDDSGLRRLLQKRLEQMAYKVDVAKDGQEGLTMFEQDGYDLVITDYDMPVYNGMEVLERLKERTPVIVLTGQGDERVAVDAMKLGASDYVIKDINGEYFKILPMVIDRVMERQQLIGDKQQALAALKASEARYRAIVEDLTELICRFQTDGKLTFANAAFCRYFGILPADIAFQSLTALLPAATYRNMKAILSGLTPQKPIAANEYEVKLNDGEVRWVHWVSHALFDDPGKIREYQIVGRDITSAKRAEESSARKQGTLRSLFKTVYRGSCCSRLRYPAHYRSQ